MSEPPPAGRAKNLLNALLIPLVALPGVFYVVRFVAPGPAPGHPLTTLNLILLLNFSLLLWLIGLAQRSTWLIDPYWTILPLLMAYFFCHYPAATFDPDRSTLVLTLLWLWSLRLTYNYFRRERWRFGWREDWRYARLRARLARHWWWISLFAVYLLQQAMLVGLVLPIYAVHRSAASLGLLDGLATAGALAGIAIAAVADTQLHRFVRRKEQRRAAKEPTTPILDQGLWRYSRHPNYFGEQLFWWSLALFGVAVGAAWTMVGTLFNSLILAQVTLLTERRMARGPRAAAWARYKRRTSVWLPLPRRHER